MKQVEKEYNRTGKVLSSSSLKKFYGNNWQARLGIDIKTFVHGGGRVDSYADELTHSMVPEYSYANTYEYDGVTGRIYSENDIIRDGNNTKSLVDGIDEDIDIGNLSAVSGNDSLDI